MKLDAYTKVVLTSIAILLGFIVFDLRTALKEKSEATGNNEMISAEQVGGVWHLRNGKIRFCALKSRTGYDCFAWTKD